MVRKSGYNVCRLRHLYNLSCRNCIYYGSECNKFKNSHHNLNPMDYYNKLAQENKITEREDM